MFADIRVALGYNFTTATEPDGLLLVRPRGFYFTISTKLSNLFDLFGTAAAGLAPNEAPQAQPQPQAQTQSSQPQTGPAQNGARPQ